MPRVSATSAPIRQGITSLAAPEPVLCDGRGASAPGCAVIFVSPCEALCLSRSLSRAVCCGSVAAAVVVAAAIVAASAAASAVIDGSGRGPAGRRGAVDDGRVQAGLVHPGDGELVLDAVGAGAAGSAVAQVGTGEP